MANDRSNFFFNVLPLENILVALTREIGDGPCFLYIEFSWIGVNLNATFNVLAPLWLKMEHCLVYFSKSKTKCTFSFRIM